MSELGLCPLCAGRVMDQTCQHDLEKQVGCEFCTFRASLADWNRRTPTAPEPVKAAEAGLPTPIEQAVQEWFDEMKVDGEPLSPRIKRYARKWISGRANELTAALSAHHPEVQPAEPK